MDANDPPIFIYNLGKNENQKILQIFITTHYTQKFLSLKIKNVVYAPRIGIIDKSGQGVVDFFNLQINGCYLTFSLF